MGLKISSLKNRFSNIINKTRQFYKQLSGDKNKYDFWDEMHNNEVATASNPARAGVEWLRGYAKQKDAAYKRQIMKPGMMYIFDYDDPKYKDTLDFWDTQPLVILLGTMKTKKGELREVGISLHLLPPRIRRLVIFRIYMMYKSDYNKNLFKPLSKHSNVYPKWQILKKQLDDLGIAFAVRMYIPELRKTTIYIKQDEWAKACWIPSKAYSKISASELEKLWREFVTTYKKKDLIGESHNTPV